MAAESKRVSDSIVETVHIVIIGKITHVGNTSMEVKVDTYVEDENGDRRGKERVGRCGQTKRA